MISRLPRATTRGVQLEEVDTGADGAHARLDSAFLVESDNPSAVVETSVRNLAIFFDGIKRGEFDHLVVGVLEPAV